MAPHFTHLVRPAPLRAWWDLLFAVCARVCLILTTILERYYTILFIGLPAHAIKKLILNKVDEPIIIEPIKWASIRKIFYSFAGILFSVIVTNLLYIEYFANVNYHGHPGWLMNNFISRTLVLFVTIYLPFKLLLYLMNPKPSNWKFEFIWNSFILFSQLTILYIFI